MKKKVTLILLAMAMVLSLTACGPRSNGSNTANRPNSSQNGTVNNGGTNAGTNGTGNGTAGDTVVPDDKPMDGDMMDGALDPESGIVTDPQHPDGVMGDGVIGDTNTADDPLTNAARNATRKRY